MNALQRTLEFAREIKRYFIVDFGIVLTKFDDKVEVGHRKEYRFCDKRSRLVEM